MDDLRAIARRRLAMNMTEYTITFDIAETPARVAAGTLLSEAARLAGVEISQPCGGQGRCGRCAVLVANGGVRRRSALRLSPQDVAQGYALACQAVVEGDATIVVPPQEEIVRHLTADRTAAAVTAPAGYDPATDQTIRRFALTLHPPGMEDQTDDWSRLQTALRREAGLEDVQISLPLLRRIGPVLRQGEWAVTALLDVGDGSGPARLLDIAPGHAAAETPLWGAAVDIGTTTVSVWLVDLLSGEVKEQAAEYNRQISRGEDIISRIIYAGKNDGLDDLRSLVLRSINELIERTCQRLKIEPATLYKATIAGNSAMIHLLLGIPPDNIRLMPFITAVNAPPSLRAEEVGLNIHPEAAIDCLPGAASYVGADISAGVLASGMDDSQSVSLFIDIGTNGETVLGSQEWLATCACSAGPAFEGAGVLHGMRATRGAIEEVWINSQTLEPAYRVIGGGRPRGLCGSGLISLLAELFLAGILDKSGNLKESSTGRVRPGQHGLEYVVAWAEETETERDIALTRVDIDNLLRAKAAIYAGFTVLAESVGLSLSDVERVLIGGAFGQYINVEKAIQIGLLPDMAWDAFSFLGNTSVRGAYLALLDRKARARIAGIARRMTYIELSADNSFYDAFTSALFLPHTDLNRFPSVVKALEEIRAGAAPAEVAKDEE